MVQLNQGVGNSPLGFSRVCHPGVTTVKSRLSLEPEGLESRQVRCRAFRCSLSDVVRIHAGTGDGSNLNGHGSDVSVGSGLSAVSPAVTVVSNNTQDIFISLYDIVFSVYIVIQC